MNILVAEDNDVNQLLIKKMLEKMGFNVDIVENGQKAVDAVLGNHYDIVFMDIQMPVLNGIEASEKIMKEMKSPPPIVAVTANVFEEDKNRCLKAGMKDHIGKPFRAEDLQNAIKKYVQQ